MVFCVAGISTFDHFNTMLSFTEFISVRPVGIW